MPDEPLPITPLAFTQHIVHTVEVWPERTSVTQAWLDMAHVYGAMVNGDLLTFNIFNGTATYRLTPAHASYLPNGGYLADLVEGKITRRRVEG